MNIRYRPQVYIPEDEEQTSKNSGDKTKHTEVQHEQNQIKEMSEIEKYEEIRKHMMLEKKCSSQEAHHKQFNDEDRKEVRQKEKEKQARDMDEYRKIEDEDSGEQKEQSKKKRVYFEDESSDEEYFIKNTQSKKTSQRRIANRRMQREASLLRG